MDSFQIMAVAKNRDVLDDLRAKIAPIALHHTHHSVIPFGIADLDACLPAGGLERGALHEFAGGGLGAVHGAASVLFIAGILARLEGSVLWCLRARDLFAPALAAVGLHPNRVIYAEAGDEKSVLLCVEEGLRQGGLAGVAGEVSKLSMTASRRLQLAAEKSGVPAFVIRRARKAADAAEFAQPTAAVTRWRITAMPSSPLHVAGVGRSRWFVELIRCRGGESAAWELEACDETGRLALPADLADRSAAPADGRYRASA
jgi:protein ImuA